MAVVTMKELLQAGVHFGHQTRRWDPKMNRFIFGERNGIYIIDLNQTLSLIDDAYRYVRDLVAGGGSILFVGTKKQAQESVQSAALRCQMPYVNERWLGGMLTNFTTIHGRVSKMHEIEQQLKSAEADGMPKKEILGLRRELEKLHRNLGGIRGLRKAPQAIFVIDTKKEHIAVTEANKLKIPVVAIVDTNCNPDVIDYVIPGNDDAIRSSALLCRVIADAAQEGHRVAARRADGASKAQAAPAPMVPLTAQLSPEEAARRADQQAQARKEAAAAQHEREQRLLAAKASERPAQDVSTVEGPAAGEAAAEGADAHV